MKKNKKDYIKNICIIRLSALGDCCHAYMVITHIKKKFSQSHITWIIGKKEYQLFKDLEGVEFITVDKKKIVHSFLKIRKIFRKRRVDFLLNMHASMYANLISLAIRSTKKIGYDKYRARDFQHWFCHEAISSKKNQHVLEGMLEFAKHINVNCKQLSWQPLALTAEDNFALNIIDSKKYTCVISPCSSRYYKDWSIDRYVDLLEYLRTKDNLQIILTGSQSSTENRYCEKLKLFVNNKTINLMGKTSIREMAALIKYADIVISPDSGPVHIGTIMKTPVIGLYAATNPERIGPYQSTQWLINKYPKALDIYLNKSLKDVKWGRKIKHSDAMNLITPNDVIKKVNQLMDSFS